MPSTSKRFRRPTDAVLLALSIVLIVVATEQAGDPGTLEAAFADWLAALPSLFDFLWAAAYDLVQIWIVVIAVLAVLRKRWRASSDCSDAWPPQKPGMRSWQAGAACANAGSAGSSRSSRSSPFGSASRSPTVTSGRSTPLSRRQSNNAIT